MLTPIDIQNHKLKSTMGGYNKKDTDDFLASILESFEILYKENQDLKDKITSLSEGVQYYKQMEGTLQKALVLAEKTSNETQEAAKSQADSLIRDANAQAEILKSKANQELEETRNHIRKLVQSYENYRLQFKKLAESQIEMLDSEAFSIYAPELDELMDNAPGAGADIQPASKQAIVIDSSVSKQQKTPQSITQSQPASQPQAEVKPQPLPQPQATVQTQPSSQPQPEVQIQTSQIPQSTPQQKSPVIEFISPDEDTPAEPQKAMTESPFVTPDEPEVPKPEKKMAQGFVSPFVDDNPNNAFVSPFVDDEPIQQEFTPQPQAVPQKETKQQQEFLSPFVDDEPQSQKASPFTFIDPE